MKDFWGAAAPTTPPDPTAAVDVLDPHAAPRPTGTGTITPAQERGTFWSIDRLTDARFTAQRERADALVFVAQGMSSVWDVLALAGQPDGRALLRLTLRQLLSAQSGWSMRRAEDTVRKIVQVSGASIKDRPLHDLDVAWLLDPRVGGKRFVSLCDAMHTAHPGRGALPWPGFPFAPAPFDAVWAQEDPR